MTEAMRELYQEVILDHGRRPRNFRTPGDANRTADGYNPLCGDRVRFFARLENGVVRDAAFQGTGCAISTASASMMSEAVRGRTVVEARELFNRFHGMVTGEQPAGDLGKLGVFAGVRDYPARVKCATLIWHTLMAALEDRDETVSTE